MKKAQQPIIKWGIIILILSCIVPSAFAQQINLQLNSTCSPSGESITWRVRNHDDITVSFTWELFNSNQTGSGTIDPKSESSFQTALIQGTNTVTVRVNGAELARASRTSNGCNPAPEATGGDNDTGESEPGNENNDDLASCGREDCSSVSVSAVCAGGLAVFTITNTGEPGNGDMIEARQWRIYVNDVLLESGSFMLNGGQSGQVTYQSNGQAIRLEADQQPWHPGNSQPRETIICGDEPVGETETPAETATETPAVTETEIASDTPTEAPTETETASDTPTEAPTATDTPAEAPTETEAPTATGTPAATEAPVECEYQVTAGDAPGFAQAVDLANNDGHASIICLGGGTYSMNAGLSLNTEILILGNGSRVVPASNFGTSIFTVNAADISIEDLSIDNGLATYGGGMLVNGGSVSLNSVNFNANLATRDGGAIYNYNGVVTITDGRFTSNEANVAGAILNTGTSSVLTVSNTVFADNQAVVAGALRISNGDFIMTDSEIRANLATSEASAISLASNGTVTIQATVITQNVAPSGSALSTNNTQFAVNNSCIFDNSSGANDVLNTSIAGSINAINNWWGSANGPGTAGADTVSSLVDTMPYSGTSPDICPA